MRHLINSLVAFLPLCFIGANAYAESNGYESTKLKSNPKLQSPITLYREHILLGDLIRKIGSDTGVALAISERETSLGAVELTAGVPGTPAWKILDAITSLNLGSGGVWTWSGDGTREHPYVLSCSKSLDLLATQERQKLKATYRDHIESMLHAATLSPVEREHYWDTHPEYVPKFRPSGRTILGQQLIAACSPQVREKIFSGGEVHFRFQDLPPAGQEMVRQGMSIMAKLNPDKVEFKGDPPQDIMVASLQSSRSVCPAIRVFAGPLGGYGVLGGLNLEESIRRDAELEWMADATRPGLPEASLQRDLPSLTGSAVKDDKQIGTHAPTPESQPSGNFQRASVERLIIWLSQAYRTPIITDITWRDLGGVIVQGKQPATLQDALKGWSGLAPLMLKDRNGIVLMRDRAWYQNEAYGRVPFRLIEDIRNNLAPAEPSTAAVFSALAPAAEYDEAQLHVITRITPLAQLVPHIRAGLLAYQSENTRGRRGLLSKSGILFSDLSTSTKNRLTTLQGGGWPGASLARERGARLHLLMTHLMERIKVGYEVSLEDTTEQSLPTLIPDKPDAPLFLAQEDDLVAAAGDPPHQSKARPKR